MFFMNNSIEEKYIKYLFGSYAGNVFHGIFPNHLEKYDSIMDYPQARSTIADESKHIIIRINEFVIYIGKQMNVLSALLRRIEEDLHLEQKEEHFHEYAFGRKINHNNLNLEDVRKQIKDTIYTLDTLKTHLEYYKEGLEDPIKRWDVVKEKGKLVLKDLAIIQGYIYHSSHHISDAIKHYKDVMEHYKGQYQTYLQIEEDLKEFEKELGRL